MNIVVRNMLASDWPEVARIYKLGIDTGLATFEKDVPPWESWDTSHLKSCRLIAHSDATIAGWTALTAVSSRCVYAGVAEVSVYICPKFKQLGVGTLLLDALIKASEQEGIWTLQSSMFLENKASIALHKKLDFREVGIRKSIGQLNGIWRDTCLMERRSKII